MPISFILLFPVFSFFILAQRAPPFQTKAIIVLSEVHEPPRLTAAFKTSLWTSKSTTLPHADTPVSCILKGFIYKTQEVFPFRFLPNIGQYHSIPGMTYFTPGIYDIHRVQRKKRASCVCRISTILRAGCHQI